MNSSQPSSEQRFDSALFDLLPHRPPMLLINRVLSLSASESSAEVWIDAEAPFYSETILQGVQERQDEQPAGIPAWVGLEYMGQTAALIAGYQLQQGLTQPHLGFLLGSRRFTSHVTHFAADSKLLISCVEKALVGDSLATFDCEIRLVTDIVTTSGEAGQLLASATLSVLRKPLEQSQPAAPLDNTAGTKT